MESSSAPSVPQVPMDIPEGRIASPATEASARAAGISFTDLQTLDEPVTATIMRDLRKIAIKLRYVLAPTANQSEATKELRNWDLWGPLLLCLILSSVLSINAATGQASYVFASVFVLVWAGSAVVTLNAKLLGAHLSFFQSLCVLGYCVCPLVLASLLCLAISNTLVRTILVGVAYVWTTRASVIFMREMVKEGRRILALYPIFLFYIVISWMVFVQ